ncbi:flagellar biosynthesis protein FlgN [Sulfitobacter sp. TSTF-M16]|uniref:Flagellar biosynthesis protein FlgN n=1 Tax=Sulfitobacter aestuariivivens TaxID=2766981 RepID=A0A927D6W0_9RHOB|nr:flagellar biosynthesis protein FlgN [Sulfitobacter aestuariivivens]
MDALEDLLDAERSALLSGDLVALTQMLPAKEALFDVLNDDAGLETQVLAELNGKVRRNQLLLDSALKGIRDATARMTSVRHLRSSLETYGSDGRKQNIQIDGAHALEKRA